MAAYDYHLINQPYSFQTQIAERLSTVLKKIERDVEEPDLYNLARCVLRLNPEERKPAALLVNDAWIAADSPIKTNKGKYTRALAVDLHVNTSRGTELTNMSAKARSKFQGNEGSLPPLEPSTPAIPTARKNVEIGKEICRQLGIEARNESGVLPSMGVTISEKAKQRGDSEA